MGSKTTRESEVRRLRLHQYLVRINNDGRHFPKLTFSRDTARAETPVYSGLILFLFFEIRSFVKRNAARRMVVKMV